MKLDVVKYKKLLVQLGVALTYVGMGILFINLLPKIPGYFEKIIMLTGVAVIAIGCVVINYYTKNIDVIGTIIIHTDITQIHFNSANFTISNQDFKCEFSNSGYKGMSNYIPFLTVHSFTTFHGINEIIFYNNSNKYRFEILISSQRQQENLLNILKDTFKIS